MNRMQGTGRSPLGDLVAADKPKLSTRIRETLAGLPAGGDPHWIVRPLGLRERGDAIFNFELLAERDEAPAFEAGQSIPLSFPGEGILAEARLVPILSAPSSRERLSFCLRDEDDWTLALRCRLEAIALEGARPIKARLGRPWGKFCLDRGTGPLRHVFIARGMGAVPLISMLGELASRGRREGRLLFIWGADTRDELFALDEMEGMCSLIAGARFVPVLAHDPLWRGERGEVDGELLARLVPAAFDMRSENFEWALPSFYLSGPRALVRDLGLRLLSLGALKAALHLSSGRA